jgi:hypothetical protein
MPRPRVPPRRATSGLTFAGFKPSQTGLTASRNRDPDSRNRPPGIKAGHVPFPVRPASSPMLASAAFSMERKSALLGAPHSTRIRVLASGAQSAVILTDFSLEIVSAG